MTKTTNPIEEIQRNEENTEEVKAVNSFSGNKVEQNHGLSDLNAQLFLAIKENRLDACKRLINAGADVNARDVNGSGSIHYAARKGNIPIANLLLEKGANINAINNQEMNPLEIAAEKGKTSMVKSLLKNGADFKHQDPLDRDALTFAIQAEKTKTVKIIIEFIAYKTAQVPDKIRYINEKDHKELWRFFERLEQKMEAKRSTTHSKRNTSCFGRWKMFGS